MSDNPAGAERTSPARARYLTGCARAFRVGNIDCNQSTLEK
ncbi:class I SAM-dependent methyltransferase [Mycobacterium sp. E1747]|nr:class I SAM-dependent methyltransferase [Mycobacterium sp. E1747]